MHRGSLDNIATSTATYVSGNLGSMDPRDVALYASRGYLLRPNWYWFRLI